MQWTTTLDSLSQCLKTTKSRAEWRRDEFHDVVQLWKVFWSIINGFDDFCRIRFHLQAYAILNAGTPYMLLIPFKSALASRDLIFYFLSIFCMSTQIKDPFESHTTQPNSLLLKFSNQEAYVFNFHMFRRAFFLETWLAWFLGQTQLAQFR